MEKIKFKPGDKVVIAPKIYLLQKGSIFWTMDMNKYKGKTVTIAAVNINNTYKIKEDNLSHSWIDEWFESKSLMSSFLDGSSELNTVR